MSRALQTCTFAALAALMLGAVFWMQPGGSDGAAARPRVALAHPTRAQAAAIVEPEATARVEVDVFDRPAAVAIEAERALPTVTPRESPSGRARVDLLGLDGRPVAGRSVRLDGPELEGPSVRFTDDAGVLLLEGLRPGRWSFKTWPEGDELLRAGIAGSFERRFEFRSQLRESLAAGEARSLVLGVRGADEARLHGRLTRAGVGVAGRLEPRHVPSGVVRATETDADGRFEVALDPPGTWRVEARRSAALVLTREPSEDERTRAVSAAVLSEVHEGTASVRTLELAPGADLRVDLELPTGSIAGSVVGADGRPTAAVVELWSREAAVARAHVRPPQARFDFQDVGAGDWVLSVGDYGFAALSAFAPGLPVAGQAQTVALAADEALERTLQLAPARHRVGRVTDAAGRGVEGAHVLVWHLAAPGEPRMAGISIADGRFWTPALLPGPLALVAFAEERVSPALQLEHALGSAREVEFDLRLGAGAFVEIEGAGARPSLCDADGREFAALARASAGRWLCGPLPPGVWRVAFEDSTGTLAEFELALAAGERRSLRP